MLPDITNRTAISLELLQAWSPFQRYMETIRGYVDLGCTVRSVTIEGVVMFGPRVGFVLVDADVVDTHGVFLKPIKDAVTGLEKPASIPCADFLRSDAVGMLLIVTSRETGAKYIPLVEQLRTPHGGRIIELPAGMIDKGGSFAGQAAKEIEEELGVNIGKDELIRLDVADGVYPSVGGCGERLQYFLAEKEMEEAAVAELHGQEHGVAAEGEAIRVILIPIEKIEDYFDADGKIATVWSLYQRYVRLMGTSY